MGIPSFFKWLSARYPKCVCEAEEERQIKNNGKYLPIDASAPNPNGVEYDNLYLDMNGIIHNCSHNQDLDYIPSNEDDMLANMTMYLDRIFSVIRPRNLLFIAIDGVAPRAKMNQQRARRFRAINESKEASEAKIDLLNETKIRNIEDIIRNDANWDSNVITPGSEFLAKVSKHTSYYIHEKITNDKAWKDIKIIFSDANVPGEGEHKIMEYIRSQREQENYNPNLK